MPTKPAAAPRAGVLQGIGRAPVATPDGATDLAGAALVTDGAGALRESAVALPLVPAWATGSSGLSVLGAFAAAGAGAGAAPAVDPVTPAAPEAALKPHQ